MDSQSSNTKIKLGALVLMIFSSIFGFSNSLTAFYQMGYASIIWYIVTAVLFFLPSALMFAEYGASFKASHGCAARSVKSQPLSELLSGWQLGSSGWYHQPSSSWFRYQP